jgi:hypothetical protein
VEAEQRSTADMLRLVDKPAGRSTDPILVLEPNRWCVMVFQGCSWTVHVGMSKKPIHQGISAQEIRAAAALVRAPRSEWPRILQGITEYMVPAALSWFNR